MISPVATTCLLLDLFLADAPLKHPLDGMDPKTRRNWLILSRPLPYIPFRIVGNGD